MREEITEFPPFICQEVKNLFFPIETFKKNGGKTEKK